jgi:hypothetical protein
MKVSKKVVSVVMWYKITSGSEYYTASIFTVEK